MSYRFSPRTTGLLVVTAMALTSSLSWAYFYELGPAKDEWGLKYEGEVTATNDDKLNVSFTLADQGRLQPIYSISVTALSDPTPSGVRTYILNERIELKLTKDGKLTGQTQISKKFADRAKIRILTQYFDGQPQTAGARYYDIPLKKFMKRASEPGSTQASPSIASPPASKITK